jgi:hypothetical protein
MLTLVTPLFADDVTGTLPILMLTLVTPLFADDVTGTLSTRPLMAQHFGTTGHPLNERKQRKQRVYR